MCLTALEHQHCVSACFIKERSSDILPIIHFCYSFGGCLEFALLTPAESATFNWYSVFERWAGPCFFLPVTLQVTGFSPPPSHFPHSFTLLVRVVETRAAQLQTEVGTFLLVHEEANKLMEWLDFMLRPKCAMLGESSGVLFGNFWPFPCVGGRSRFTFTLLMRLFFTHCSESQKRKKR